MIEILNDIAKDVIGFKLSGEVSGEDYEKVLIPALKSKLKQQSGLKVLYQVSENFDSYDFSAMVNDAKAGFMFYTAWEKIAVLSDIGWIINCVKAFSFTIPAKVKTFSNSEIQKAKDWLTQKDMPKINMKISLDKKSKIAILEPLGALSKDDFVKAKEIIDPFIQKKGKLNGVIIYTKDFPGWNSFEAFGAHMKFIKKHHKRIKKLAFVTNSWVIDTADKIGKYFVNVKIKNFKYEELKKAKKWISS